MAIRVTRWSPDTCDCVIEYEWDDAVAPENRAHTLRSITKDGVHGGQTNANAFSTIQTENRVKNRAIYEKAKEIIPAAKWEEFVTVVTWNISGSPPNRVLNVHSNGSLTAQEIADVQATCDATFGPGRVVVD